MGARPPSCNAVGEAALTEEPADMVKDIYVTLKATLCKNSQVPRLDA